MGGQCTAGSRILEGYRAPYDAHITERLRDAGAVVLGKTNMDEFAMGSSTEHSAYGPTANPWALDRVPGGSSGGSAVAVAAYHAPLSIGTDTGGSIRQPAALCGIVGLKPTYGRVSRYGIVAFASSLDQIGPLARDARDAATLLHAVAGRDDRDSTSSPQPVPASLTSLPAGNDEAAVTLQGKRLGLPREYFVAGMEPGVEARVRAAVRDLEAAGATIEEVSLPHTDYGLATYYIVAPAEASANLARYDGIRFGAQRVAGDVLANYLATRGAGFGAEVKRRIMLGTYALSAGYYDAFYLKAQKVRTLIKGDFDALWAQGFDALVAPTSATVAFSLGARLADPVAMYLSDACTLPVNMAGLPGVSIPCGLSDGLPVGLQIIGAPWSEAEILRLARGYEAVTADAPWRSLEPAQLGRAADPAAPTPAERAATLARV
jgi:aspartyl-tRNA(Asn)/glutamyl-tRNA(Gln) amidotransferase subunit A